MRKRKGEERRKTKSTLMHVSTLCIVTRNTRVRGNSVASGEEENSASVSMVNKCPVEVK